MGNLATSYLRACNACADFLTGGDPSTQAVYCDRCRPKHVQTFDEWAASVEPGSRVYLQPYAAWRGLSHSEYLVVGRVGDTLTVQIIGIPKSRMTIDICHAGQHDLTPLAQRGAAW